MRLLLPALLALALLATSPHANGIDFQRDIQPFFAEHCLECHGADKAKGGLALTSKKAALKTLESGAVAITPGDPSLSAIIARLETNDKDDVMPPLKKSKRPSANEITKVKDWIKSGAEWSQHWAYAPIAKQATTGEAGVAARIDSLVLERLKTHSIQPSPEADKTTLLKRVYYDLLGLPPNEEEADTFLRDQTPGAYERLVEHALASPHFGERWGRHWLDQAR